MAEIIVVHGHPGSGKSTQSGRLNQCRINNRQIIHVSTGSRLRDIRTGVAESEFQDIINNPNAPSPLDNHVVNGATFELIPSYPSNTLVLLDGYPRQESAVDIFTRAARDNHHNILGCVNLEIPLETSVSRLIDRGARGGEKIKADTIEEFAKRRYEEHDATIMRAINKLTDINQLIRVDADADIEIVWKRFYIAVGKLAISSSLLRKGLKITKFVSL